MQLDAGRFAQVGDGEKCEHHPPWFAMACARARAAHVKSRLGCDPLPRSIKLQGQLLELGIERFHTARLSHPS